MTEINQKNYLASATLQKLWSNIDKASRRRLAGLLIIGLTNSFLEVISISLVFPFLSLLADINTSSKELTFPFSAFFRQFGFAPSLSVVTISFISVNLLALLLKLYNVKTSHNLAASVGNSLSKKLYESIISLNYEKQSSLKVEEVVTAVTKNITTTIACINAILQLFSSSFVFAFILSGLLIISLSISLTTGAILLLLYILIALLVRQKLSANSRSIQENANEQIKILKDSLGGSKELVLHNLQYMYYHKYSKCDARVKYLQAQNQYITLFPRYIMEFVSIAVIAVWGWILIYNDNTSVIPLLGVFSLSAQKLLPALQQIFRGWAYIKACGVDIEILDYYNNLDPNNKFSTVESFKPENISDKKSANTLPILFDIELKDVCFRYKTKDDYTLNNINLVVTSGSKIGIVGETGSGKSTLVDLIMGLLTPTKGKILVNNHSIGNDEQLMSLWQKNIAHVSQEPYLLSGTIAENIAFDYESFAIDFDRLAKVSSMANISSFIDSLPMGYDTLVGERGVLLSGGQRQRIAIARALYKNSSIIVLDEATSALDYQTEKTVMQSIYSLPSHLTVFIIAHRLSTLSFCDHIIEVKNNSAFIK